MPITNEFLCRQRDIFIYKNPRKKIRGGKSDTVRFGDRANGETKNPPTF